MPERTCQCGAKFNLGAIIRDQRVCMDCAWKDVDYVRGHLDDTVASLKAANTAYAELSKKCSSPNPLYPDRTFEGLGVNDKFILVREDMRRPAVIWIKLHDGQKRANCRTLVGEEPMTMPPNTKVIWVI